ncbi:DnaD domain protein [Paenibacillus polymyxa]|uniref:DnaD domain-containing protein n=1 Tax=Paenibacillus polymyxa TaxID=1406 RepID=UPI0021E46947|nr:hypothetical protein [Paenibacillus polymyxa]
MDGWIKLHRKIQDHWIYQEKRKFSRYEAWLDMLMMANHKSNKFLHGNELVVVEKGQFITSEIKLMERWDWGKNKLRLYLDLLEKDGMIIKKSDRKRTTITLCNYGVYHDSETESGPRADHGRTDNGLITDTNKNEKNVKNEKNDISTTTTEREMTVMDAYTKAFGALVMNGLIQGYVHELQQKGCDDSFLIELLLETGESSARPNLKLLKAIGDSWLERGIRSRQQAKEGKREKTGERHGRDERGGNSSGANAAGESEYAFLDRQNRTGSA